MGNYIIMAVVALALTSCLAVNPTSCPAWGSCSSEDVKEISVKLNKIN